MEAAVPAEGANQNWGAGTVQIPMPRGRIAVFKEFFEELAFLSIALAGTSEIDSCRFKYSCS